MPVQKRCLICLGLSAATLILSAFFNLANALNLKYDVVTQGDCLSRSGTNLCTLGLLLNIATGLAAIAVLLCIYKLVRGFLRP